MTKFEEEVDKVAKQVGYESLSLLCGDCEEANKIYIHFKNWHSDEEFQAEKDARKKEYEIHQDIYSKTSKKLNEAELEIANLKSQLQQQALPVVPECVDIWIKKCQELNWMITDVLAPESWSSDFAKDTENWLKKSKENFNLLALAFITGKYEVEKPQLFYLKHELTGQFLAKDNHIKDEDRYFFWTGANPLTHSVGTAWKLTFTQSEIDRIQCGLEQIEVTE